MTGSAGARSRFNPRQALAPRGAPDDPRRQQHGRKAGRPTHSSSLTFDRSPSIPPSDSPEYGRPPADGVTPSAQPPDPAR